ncbi:MAG TPA: FecR domain-containing protein [Thermohalobaculum sp.]|nr:FecR domain-containing protein [Thermohalobaculum sp.]
MTAAAIAGSPVLAQAGELKSVLGEVSASGPPGKRALKQGSRVVAGDRVEVGGGGNAQIEFTEATRLVAGGAAVLTVATLDVNVAPGRTKTLELDALDGVFRFMSDETGEKNFKIRAPSATIELSGTALELAVTPGGAWTLLLDGRIKMCGTAEGAECKTATRRCTMLRTLDAKTIEVVPGSPEAPIKDDGEGTAGGGASYAQEIEAHFPYQKAQSDLLEEFQLAGEPCEEERVGGLGDFALDGSQVRHGKAIRIGVMSALGAGIACILLCGKTSTTSTNKTN